jgi:hypothetical protein
LEYVEGSCKFGHTLRHEFCLGSLGFQDPIQGKDASVPSGKFSAQAVNLTALNV